MLKFVLDEDMPRSTGKFLKDAGYKVKDIRDYNLRGAEDEQVFKFAQNEKSVLITSDIDFANTLKFPLGEHYGIVIVRFPNEISNNEMNRQIILRLKELSEDDFFGNLIIIEPMKIRIKRKNKL
jgi:predicted nuclease of predicted toxin-antitoxin system